MAQEVCEHGGVTSWWAQTIAVAFEQSIGRRQPGQTNDGKYQVSVSKTVDGTLDQALHKWLAVIARRQSFSKMRIVRTLANSGREKFRYWRCGLSDGSRVNVGSYQKEPGKAVIGLRHENLKSHEQINHWRAFWKSLLTIVFAPSTHRVPRTKKPSARTRRVATMRHPRRRR